MDRDFDILVIGSGIAGLFYALRVSEQMPKARIALVTKKNETATNTNRAQGGIAAVLSGTDSFDAHIADTIKVGCGLCNKDVVERVVGAGPSVIQELMEYGVKFTAVGGQLDLGREGGHSANRVVHASDLTGKEIERALVAACRAKSDTIQIFRDHIALDLIKTTTGGKSTCVGAFIFSEAGRLFTAIYAPVTMLATGGLGQVYYHTSNPEIATGDGVAMAYRIGIPVANLEFIQFHPTTLYAPGREPFLISEAVRGEGARLKSTDGRYLMENAHELKDLAPRDIVAQTIDKELKASGEEYVYLDISHRDPEFVKQRFPNIYNQCLQYGFDITIRPIPVVPAAHYSCGGVLSTIEGETDLPGLFTAGEVAMTGMHGANRLASNSLLEAVVMARFASEKSVDYLKHQDFTRPVSVENALHSSLAYPREKILIAHDRRELRRVMSDFVGIVRTEDRLALALEKIHQIRAAIDQYYMATPATYNVVELRNLASVAELIIQCAISRRESRGLHYLDDRPGTNDAFLRDTIITAEKGAQ